MTKLYSILFLFLPIAAAAQTVVSVQNGLWTTPSTWDCTCVPNSTQSVVVMNSIQVFGDLTLDHPQVQVTSIGEINMSFPGTVVINTTLIMEGHMFLQGAVSVAQLMDVSGFFEMAGNLTVTGEVVLDSGLVVIEGDLLNEGTLGGGPGSVCVFDITNNSGTIGGSIDVCDFSPTTSTPPILDVNTGTVDPGVTFCSNSACYTRVDEVFGSEMMLRPALADAMAELAGIPASGASVQVVDVHGRSVLPEIRTAGPALALDVSVLPTGLYRVVVFGTTGSRSLPLVIAR